MTKRWTHSCRCCKRKIYATKAIFHYITDWTSAAFCSRLCLDYWKCNEERKRTMTEKDYDHTADHEAILRDRAAGHLNNVHPWVVYSNGSRHRVFKTFEEGCAWASEAGILGRCTIRHYDRDTEEISAIILPSETDTLVDERITTHGDFGPGSAIWQKLMQVYYDAGAYGKLSPSQLMAFTMIAMKQSRILNGNPNYHDHWDDIAGYANLASRELKKEKKA